MPQPPIPPHRVTPPPMPPAKPKRGGMSWGKAFLISGTCLAGFCVLLIGVSALSSTTPEPAPPAEPSAAMGSTPQSPLPQAAKPPEPQKSPEAPLFAQIDVKELFYKSPKEVESILGKAVEVTPIRADESTEGMTPGEFRDYEWEGATATVLTRFLRGQLVSVQIYTKKGYSSPSQALQDFGIDPSPVRPMSSNEYHSRWTAKIDGFLFKTASANRVDSDEPFNIVQFVVADPD